MPPGQQVKVHKSASFVDITTFCDRKGYRTLGLSVRIAGVERGPSKIFGVSCVQGLF